MFLSKILCRLVPTVVLFLSFLRFSIMVERKVFILFIVSLIESWNEDFEFDLLNLKFSFNFSIDFCSKSSFQSCWVIVKFSFFQFEYLCSHFSILLSRKYLYEGILRLSRISSLEITFWKVFYLIILPSSVLSFEKARNIISCLLAFRT